MNIKYKMSVPHIMQKKKQNKTTTVGCYYYLSLFDHLVMHLCTSKWALSDGCFLKHVLKIMGNSLNPGYLYNDQDIAAV